MRKMERLFEIVQLLTLAGGPVTAARLAARLEVAERTVYRDIASLQAMRVPIEGERGLGYVLRPGFLLPPLMLTAEETEAVTVALGLLARRGDDGLRRAAEGVLGKVASAVPPPLRGRLAEPALHVWGAPVPAGGADLSLLRQAIRDEHKLAIRYRDEAGRDSTRVVLPVALVYYAETANLVAFCELRQDIRHFRPDRMLSAALSGGRFTGRGDALRRQWQQGWTGAAA